MTQAYNLSQLANNLNTSGQLDATDGLVNAVPIANGGTGASSASSARTNLGLGTIATQAANNVAITGGSITGITDLAVADGGTGASSITANNVVLGNGSGALSGNLVAPGANGNLLTSNGTTWTSAAPPTQYAGPNAQVFTSSGTFTVPTGVTRVIAYVFGGGGGGCGQNGFLSGLGGQGGFGAAYITGLTPGASITVTVGGGGNGGNGYTVSNTGGSFGTSGGTSSFGSYLSCTGGGGGTQSVSSVQGSATFSSCTALLKNNGAYHGGGDRGLLGDSVGGGGMSGGGGTAGYSGGAANGPGSDGSAGSSSGNFNGGAGGGSAGGAGGTGNSGAGNSGGGGGGTGGVIVYW